VSGTVVWEVEGAVACVLLDAHMMLTAAAACRQCISGVVFMLASLMQW
jgi:hypothetical protein